MSGGSCCDDDVRAQFSIAAALCNGRKRCGADDCSSDPSGNISYDEMEAAIRPHTKAIVCTNGSNLSGNMIDIARVGELRRDIRCF